MSKKVLRTITIDELDQGYKVTTDTRGGGGPCDLASERQYRQELAVANLGKTIKIVKDYLLPDITAEGEDESGEQTVMKVGITSAEKMNTSGSKEDIKVPKRGV